MKLSEMLGPYLQPTYNIVSAGFADYNDSKLYSDKAKLTHSPSCRSHIRNCHMKARAAEFASAHPDDVRLFDADGLQGILIKQVIAILFKKLDGDLKSRNNPTKQIENYRAQGEIPGIPAVFKLIAGYTEDPETGEMTGIYLTRPSGYGNRWEMELTANEIAQIPTPLFDDEEEVEEVKILPRKEPGEVIPFKREQKDGDDK